MTTGSTYGLLLLALPVVLLVILMVAQRRNQRAARDVQASVVVGDRIMTTSGLQGTVASLDDTTMGLEVAPGVILTFDRRAIGMKVS